MCIERHTTDNCKLMHYLFICAPIFIQINFLQTGSTKTDTLSENVPNTEPVEAGEIPILDISEVMFNKKLTLGKQKNVLLNILF